VDDHATADEEPSVVELHPDDMILAHVEDVGVAPGRTRIPPPSGFEDHGMEALAFYFPFHFHGPAWGIRIRESGLIYVAEELKGRAVTPKDTALLRMAKRVLYEHELFHCVCEVAAALGELAHCEPWYTPYFTDRDATELEEALSNVQAFAAVRGKRATARLKTWMTSQPGGYGRFEKYLEAAAFREAQRTLARAMRFRAPDSLRPPSPWPAELLWPPSNNEVRESIPCRLIKDKRVDWLKVGRPYPKFLGMRLEVWSREHEPPHFHLFVPPDREYGHGYRWPDLSPVSSDSPALRSKLRKKVFAYMECYGERIRADLQRVYARELPALVHA